MVELFETKVWETLSSPLNPCPLSFWQGTYVLPRNGEIESARIPIKKGKTKTHESQVKRYLPKKGFGGGYPSSLPADQLPNFVASSHWTVMAHGVGDLGGMTRIATAPPLWRMALVGSIRIVVTQEKCFFSCLFSWRVSHWQFATSSLGTTLCQLRSWWNCGWALPVDSQA